MFLIYNELQMESIFYYTFTFTNGINILYTLKGKPLTTFPLTRRLKKMND
jgi:hypothetical protein